MYQKGWMYNMILPWLTGGIAALDLFIKDEIEREGEEEFPRDLPGTKGLIRLHKSYNSGFPFGLLKERPELVKGIFLQKRAVWPRRSAFPWSLEVLSAIFMTVW